MPASNEPLQIGEYTIRPGERQRLDLPVALLPTHTPLHLPLIVAHAKRPGPRVWMSAALHGDELNGVEIIRQALKAIDELRCGTLIAAPLVNVFGFIQQSRYLPDRRDLNRSFPGSTRGSLAGRIAHLFLTEIVQKCTHGLDLHTASLEKTNYPQVRGNFKDAETLRIGEAFNAPIMVQSAMRDGSLRYAAMKLGIPVLVYEGGEAQRFNRKAIDTGLKGVLGVLAELGMIGRKHLAKKRTSLLIEESSWIRARRGGLLRLSVDEGARVQSGQEIGVISDPLGADGTTVRAPFAGIVIGLTRNPVVHGGDALMHLART